MTNQTQLQTITPQTSTLKIRLFALLTGLFLVAKNYGAFLLKGGWLLKTGVTALFSFVVYGSVYGWRFAAVLIGMLIVHESGHWIWLKGNGVSAEVPIFIPFIGAIITLRKLPQDQISTAWTALAGPLVGGAGALICWIIGDYYKSGPLMAGASFGFMLNLFQLVPCMPLDGSWVLASISKAFLIPGTLIILLLAILSRSPFMFIIAILGVVSIFSKKKVEPTASTKDENKGDVVKTIGDLERDIFIDPKGNSQNAFNESAATESSEYLDVNKKFVRSQTRPKRVLKFDMERCALFSAYLILTGLLAFMSVDSMAVLNRNLHISNPITYLKNQPPSGAESPH